jgi:hypothetical protein
MVECNVGEHIGNIFTFISGNLEPVIDVFHFDDNHRVFGLKEVGYRVGKDIIGNVFKPVYLNTAIPDKRRILDRTDIFYRSFNLNGR